MVALSAATAVGGAASVRTVTLWFEFLFVLRIFVTCVVLVWVTTSTSCTCTHPPPSSLSLQLSVLQLPGHRPWALSLFLAEKLALLPGDVHMVLAVASLVMPLTCHS